MPFSNSNWETMQHKRLPQPRACWFLNDDHVNKQTNKSAIRGRSQIVISFLRILFTPTQGLAPGHLSAKSNAFQPQESVDHVSSSPPIELGPSALHIPYALSPTHHNHVHSRKRTTWTCMRVHSLPFPTHFHSKHQVSYPNWRFLLACDVDSAFCASNLPLLTHSERWINALAVGAASGWIDWGAVADRRVCSVLPTDSAKVTLLKQKQHQSHWRYTSSVTSELPSELVAVSQWGKNYELFFWQRLNRNYLKIFLVQTFGLSLRGIENATAAPFSTFSPSFDTLHKVLLITRFASVTLFCTFERKIVMHTSDSFFMNL